MKPSRLFLCVSLGVAIPAKAQVEPLARVIPIESVALATIHVEGYPDFLASDQQGVWITNENRVEKFTLKDGLVKTIRIPLPCGSMCVDFGSLWVAGCQEKSLYRLELGTGKIVATIETGLADPEGELSIASGAGSIWILTKTSGELSRIDPATNKVVQIIKVLPNSFAATYDFGAVWLTNTSNGSVQKIDPGSGNLVATIPAGPAPRFLTTGFGSVWTLNQGNGTVSRIDPVSNKLIATLETKVPGTGGDITAGDYYIYVRAKDTLLSVIDPSTNKVICRYGPAAGSGAVRVENGRVWVTAHDINTIWVLPEKL